MGFANQLTTWGHHLVLVECPGEWQKTMLNYICKPGVLGYLACRQIHRQFGDHTNKTMGIQNHLLY